MEVSNKGATNPQPDKPQVKRDYHIRDALLGITAINQDLAVFDYDNIIIRKDYKSITGVRLLSGGAAGEDFLHATLVGKGLLTAAVIGFPANPSTRLILKVIQELNIGENSGILILQQKNNDIFNFGLAADIAANDFGIKVKLLTLDDDQRETSNKRSAGIVLLIKIIGAMAQDNKSFDEIVEFHSQNSHYIATTAIDDSDDLYIPKHIEFKVLTKQTIQKSISSLNLHPSLPVAVLINVHKTMSKLDELALVKDTVQSLKNSGEYILRLYLGNFCWTTNDEASLSVVSVADESVIQYLDAPTNAIGWQQLKQYLPEIAIPPEIATKSIDLDHRQIAIKGPKFSDFQVKILRTSIDFACDAVTSCERQLNTIDKEKSEGNVGTRFKEACQLIKKDLEDGTLNVDCPKAFFEKLSLILDTAIGGPMGAIYGLLFENIANFFKKLPENYDITSETWIEIFGVAMKGVEKYCDESMQLITMFLPLKAFETVIKQEFESSRDLVAALGEAVATAEIAAQKTKLPDAVFSDAGAHAVGIWMRAVFEAVKFVVFAEPNFRSTSTMMDYS